LYQGKVLKEDEETLENALGLNREKLRYLSSSDEEDLLDEERRRGKRKKRRRRRSEDCAHDREKIKSRTGTRERREREEEIGGERDE